MAGNRVEEAGRAFSGLQLRLSELSAALGQSVAKNTAVWAEYQQRFAQVDEQLGKVVKGLVEGAAAYQQAIARYVGQVDEKLAAAMVQFRGAIEELGEVIADMESV